MRYATGLLAVLSISAIALADDGKFATPPTPKPAPTSTSLSARATFGAPIQVESLTLTPILANNPGTDEKLLVLDEAMPKKLVRIHEVDGGDVNNLRLTNRSDQPLFLLAGEVIIGGKQDRIIGSNTIVPPKKTQDVPVFCVEHGRWDNSSKEFTTANALAHGRLRGRANYDTQSDVWQEVAAKNEQRNTKSKSDTYRHVAAQQANGTLAKWEKQVNTALGKLPAASQGKLVGFAVAVNGKVASVDVFDNPALFKKLQGKLVRSYITEAIDVKLDKTAKTPTTTDVEAFIADAEKAAEQKSFETEMAASSVQKGDKAARARVMYKKAAAADSSDPSPTVAAPPKAVYENYQAR
jgi:hypothetical protein